MLTLFLGPYVAIHLFANQAIHNHLEQTLTAAPFPPKVSYVTWEWKGTKSL